MNISKHYNEWVTCTDKNIKSISLRKIYLNTICLNCGNYNDYSNSQWQKWQICYSCDFVWKAEEHARYYIYG